MDSMKFDLTQEIPQVEIRLPKGKVITLGLDEVFDYACIDADKGTLRERMPAITKQFNDDFNCEVNSSNLYLVLFQCLQRASELMGNL